MDIDCGDNSCRFATNRGGMRTNGGCRCFENAGFGPSAVGAALKMLPEITRLRAEVESWRRVAERCEAESQQARAEVALQQKQFEEFAERSGDDIQHLRAEVEKLRRVRDAAEAYRSVSTLRGYAAAQATWETLCAALDAAKES